MRKRYLFMGLMIVAGWVAGWYGQSGRLDVMDVFMLGVLLFGTIVTLVGWRTTGRTSFLGFAAVFALATAEAMYENLGGTSDIVLWTLLSAQLCCVAVYVALVIRENRQLRAGNARRT